LIEVHCFQSLKDLASLREEINALNLASERPDPFSTLEFYESYLQHDQLLSESKGFRLCFLVAFDDSRLVGYLPLKRTSLRVFGLRATKLNFFAVHDIDLPHLVARAEYAQAVAKACHDYLFGRDRNWSLLEFQQQTKDSMLFQPPFVNAPKGYVKEFSKKFRSNVGRQMRNLFAAGHLEFIGSSDPEVTPFLLDLYLGIETFSWKSQAGLSIGRSRTRIEYFRRLLITDQPMRVSILLLLLNGMPIAGLINGSYGGALYALQVVFDDRLSRLSPGAAILLLGMREAIVGGYRHFSLLSGFDYFKNRWLAEATETQSIQIYRTSSPLFWRRTFGDLVRKVLRGVRKKSGMLSNPDRVTTAVPSEESTNPAAALESRGTAEQQSRVSVLIAKVRCGQYQSLSAAELAAAMPFGMAYIGS